MLVTKPIKQLQAYTLIELLVSLAIVAILSAIAYPNYQDYVFKSRRNDAKAALMQLAVAEEKFYNQHLHYSSDISSTTGLNQQSMLSANGFYQLSATIKIYSADQIDSFILTAKAIAEQTNDVDCSSFTIDNLDNKLAYNNQGTNNLDCWY